MSKMKNDESEQKIGREKLVDQIIRCSATLGDDDVFGLALCVVGMQITSDTMKRANVDYLASRFLGAVDRYDHREDES